MVSTSEQAQQQQFVVVVVVVVIVVVVVVTTQPTRISHFRQNYENSRLLAATFLTCAGRRARAPPVNHTITN